ncbi:Zinc finger protein 112, partial [Eumeta japonica]
MFKLRECALEDYYKSIIGSMSEINYSDINVTDRQNLQLCSNLVSVFNNHIEEHYCDIKGRFSINSHGDTIESTSHSKFYEVKIENDVKAESDEIPILDLTNNEQVFTTPIQTREMSKRRKISENKYAHKRQKVKVESPVAFDYSSEESLDRSIKEESPPIQNSKRRIKRSKSTIPKRKTGKKWDPNELTPLEIKMQDKFTIKRLTLEEQLEEVAKKKMSSQYLNSKYKCDSCYKGFSDPEAYNRHVAKHDPESEKQNQETNDDIQPQQQKMAKVPGKYCQACNIMCNTSLNWKVHIESIKHKTNIANKDLTCSVCKEVLPTGEDLRLHHRKLHPNTRRRTAYGINPFLPKSWPAKCPHCTDELPNAHKYWWHFRKAHPDKQYPMVKNHICDICGKGFKGNAYLQYHRRTHFEERSYKCKQCPKSFFNRFNLQNHVKSHSDNRPYPCSVCFKAFKLKNALDRHFR